MRGEAVEVVYVDVAEELSETFCSWQEHEQLPALRSCPGVLAASWLDSLEGQPRLLLVCELENVGVAGSDQFRASLHWGSWLRSLRGWHRRSYRRIISTPGAEMTARANPSPFLLTVRVDVERAVETAFNDWYDETHLPEVLDCPGFASATRYVCVDGEPRYLALYDLDRPDALNTPEFDRVYGFGPLTPSVRSDHGRIYSRRSAPRPGS